MKKIFDLINYLINKFKNSIINNLFNYKFYILMKDIEMEDCTQDNMKEG